MLERSDFISGLSGHLYTDDESLIDVVLEDMYVDGQNVLELFYTSEYFDEYQLDFGGGVMGITCRDVLTSTNLDKTILCEVLGLRSTKQHHAVCQEILDLCMEEIKRAGHPY